MAFFLVIAPVSYAWSVTDVTNPIGDFLKSIAQMVGGKPMSMTYSSVGNGQIYSGYATKSVNSGNCCECASGGINNCQPVIGKETYIFESYYKHIVRFELLSVTGTTSNSNSCSGTTESYVNVYCTLGNTKSQIINQGKNAQSISSECDIITVDVVSQINGMICMWQQSDATAQFRMFLQDEFCVDGITPVNGCSTASGTSKVKTCDTKGGALYDNCERCNYCSQAYGTGYSCQSSSKTCYRPPQCTNGQAVGTCSGNTWCSSDGAVASFNCNQCSANKPTGKICKTDGSAWVQCNNVNECPNPTTPYINKRCENNICKSDSVQCVTVNDCSYATSCTSTDGANGKNCDICTASVSCASNTCNYIPAIPNPSSKDNNCCNVKSGWLAAGTTSCSATATSGGGSFSRIGSTSNYLMTCNSGLGSCDGCHFSLTWYGGSTQIIVPEGNTQSVNKNSAISGSVTYYQKVPAPNADADCTYQCNNGIKEAGEGCSNCPSGTETKCTVGSETCVTTTQPEGVCVAFCSDGTKVGDFSITEIGKKCITSGSSNYLAWACADAINNNRCPSGYSCITDSASATFNQCIPTCAQKNGFLMQADKQCPNNDFYTDVYEGVGVCCKTPLIQTCSAQGGISCSAGQSCINGHITSATDTEKCCVKNPNSNINQECKRVCAGIGRACTSTERCKSTTESTADVSACCLNDASGNTQCTIAPSVTIDTNSVQYSIDEALKYDLTCTPADQCVGTSAKVSLYSTDSPPVWLFEKNPIFDADGKATAELGTLTQLQPPRAPGKFTIKVHQDPYLTFPAIDISREVQIGTGLKVVANVNDIKYNNEPIIIEVTVSDYSDTPVALSRLTATATIGTQTVTPTPEMISAGKYKITVNTQQVGMMTINLNLQAANAKTYDRQLKVEVRKPTVTTKITIDGCTFTGSSCDTDKYAPLTIRARTYDPQEKPVTADMITAEISKSSGFPEELKMQRSTNNPSEWTGRFTPAQETGVFYIADITTQKAGWDAVPVSSPRINVNIKKVDLFDPVTVGGAIVVVIVVIVAYGWIQRKMAGGAVAA